LAPGAINTNQNQLNHPQVYFPRDSGQAHLLGMRLLLLNPYLLQLPQRITVQAVESWQNKNHNSDDFDSIKQRTCGNHTEPNKLAPVSLDKCPHVLHMSVRIVTVESIK
jgi:hypothetical protein